MNSFCINIHLLPNCKFWLIPNASLKYTRSINQSSFIASAFVVAKLYILLKYAIGIHSGYTTQIQTKIPSKIQQKIHQFIV